MFSRLLLSSCAGSALVLVLSVSAGVSALLLACEGDDTSVSPGTTTGSPQPEDALTFSLTSDAFKTDGSIPPRFTCDGEDISPALTWEGAPENTQTFALIMDDPDAPGGVFTHWLIYNAGGDARGFPEAVEKTEQPGDGGFQGRNDFGNIGYGGPCPPAGGAHSYDFKLYAIDGLVDLSAGASVQQLLGAIEGHILALATLIGTYERAEQ